MTVAVRTGQASSSRGRHAAHCSMGCQLTVAVAFCIGIADVF